MKCPVCKEAKLVISERSGIEIDYCPDCRGVWLDRGELDKILERSRADLESRVAAEQPDRGPAQPATGFEPRPQDPYREHYGKDHKYYKRKKSFLEDLFD